MSADAHEEAIFTFPNNGIGQVEMAGGKGPKMIADLLAVQPYGGAELRLVNEQESTLFPHRRFEGARVPEEISFLDGASEPFDFFRYRENMSVCHHRVAPLVRMVLIDAGEPGHGRVDQSRYGHRVRERGRNGIGCHAFADRPGTIERHSYALSAQWNQGRARKNKDNGYCLYDCGDVHSHGRLDWHDGFSFSGSSINCGRQGSNCQALLRKGRLIVVAFLKAVPDLTLKPVSHAGDGDDHLGLFR